MDWSRAAQSLVQSTQAFVQSLAESTSSSGNRASDHVASKPQLPLPDSVLGSAHSDNQASNLMPPKPQLPVLNSASSSANGSNTSAELSTSVGRQSSDQLANTAASTESNPHTAAATSSITGSVSRQHKAPAPARVARAHKSVLHTLDPAQSEAALARLSLSDGAAASGAGAFDDKQDSSSYGDQQSAAELQTASMKHHADSTCAAYSPGPVTADGLASLAQQQMQQRAGRVAVQSLGGLDWGMDSHGQDTERQLFTAVVQLKALVRGSRCAAMLSFPAGKACFALTLVILVTCLCSVCSMCYYSRRTGSSSGG